MEDATALGQALGPLGKDLFNGIRAYAEQANITIAGMPEDPKVDVPPEEVMTVLRSFFANFFPTLVPATKG
jgi:hypothetical protein